MSAPTLSICVPSRNRQVYFQQTIASLMASLRTDVEFVFADNSDDATIMDGFMAERMRDPRVRYLASTGRTLPMMENWERSISAASGRYVAFIGDDDYIDPDLAAFITNLERTTKPDAIAWTGPNFVWPVEGAPSRAVTISLGTEVTRLSKASLMRKAFLWEGPSHVPLSGFSIYHGALSRGLLDKIRLMGNGRHFEFPIVDYEMAFKAVLLGENFIHSSRPFSVLGACPLSNSVTIGNIAAERESQRIFFCEHGWNMNDAEWMEGTPFRTWHGVTACIYLIQHWLARKIGMQHHGFEENLVRAFAANCGMYRRRADFDQITGEFRQALAGWHGGQYLQLFTPRFFEPAAVKGPRAPAFTGLGDNSILHFPDNIAGVRTPGELFRLFADVIMRAEDIPIDAGKLASQPAIAA
jgi:glycosyltransferase involved in cell wall biosynthesis